jgi:hypothetical protein
MRPFITKPNISLPKSKGKEGQKRKQVFRYVVRKSRDCCPDPSSFNKSFCWLRLTLLHTLALLAISTYNYVIWSSLSSRPCNRTAIYMCTAISAGVIVLRTAQEMFKCVQAESWEFSQCLNASLYIIIKITDIIHRPIYTLPFGDWILSLSSSGTYSVRPISYS